MPKTRREKRKRVEEGFNKEMQNLEMYLWDLEEELLETRANIKGMEPGTREQADSQLKRLRLIDSILQKLKESL